METLEEFFSQNKKLFGPNFATKSGSKIMKSKKSPRKPVNKNARSSLTRNKRGKKETNNVKQSSKRNFVHEEETDGEDEEMSTISKYGKNSKDAKCKKFKAIDSSDDSATSIEENNLSFSRNNSRKVIVSDSNGENTTSNEESNKRDGMEGGKKGKVSRNKNAGKKRWNRGSSSDDEIIMEKEIENTKESSKVKCDDSNGTKSSRSNLREVVSDEEIFNFGLGNSKNVKSRSGNSKVNEITGIYVREVASEEEVFNFGSNNVKSVINKNVDAIISEKKVENNKYDSTSDEEIFNFGTKSSKKRQRSNYSRNLNNHGSASSVVCRKQTNSTPVNKEDDDTDLLLSIMSGDFASRSRSTSSQANTTLDMDLFKASGSNNAKMQNISDNDSKRGKREGTGKEKKCTDRSKNRDVLEDLFGMVDKDLGDIESNKNEENGGLSEESKAALVASLFADI